MVPLSYIINIASCGTAKLQVTQVSENSAVETIAVHTKTKANIAVVAACVWPSETSSTANYYAFATGVDVFDVCFNSEWIAS